MKINFDNNNANTDELIKGDFETLVKLRKEHLPKVQKTINEVFKNYDGEMVAVIRIKEDENGDPCGQQVFIGGVGKLETQIKLACALNEAAEEMRDDLLERCKSNPAALRALLMGMVDELTSKSKEK